MLHPWSTSFWHQEQELLKRPCIHMMCLIYQVYEFPNDCQSKFTKFSSSPVGMSSSRTFVFDAMYNVSSAVEITSGPGALCSQLLTRAPNFQKMGALVSRNMLREFWTHVLAGLPTFDQGPQLLKSWESCCLATSLSQFRTLHYLIQINVWFIFEMQDCCTICYI